MNASEKLLVILLRALAAILWLALAAVVMPFSWMQTTHRFLGMGELPETPMVDYLARSLSAFYAAHGALVFFVSLDLRRYLPLVKFLLVVALAFGAAVLAIDLHAGMPLYWTLGEGPVIIALSLLMLRLSAQAGQASA